MQRRYVDRRRLVAAMLEAEPLCQAALRGVCTGVAVDVHEVLTRARGGSILDESNCMTICPACHRWVTEHPREAVELGLMKNSWEGP